MPVWAVIVLGQILRYQFGGWFAQWGQVNNEVSGLDALNFKSLSLIREFIWPRRCRCMSQDSIVQSNGISQPTTLRTYTGCLQEPACAWIALWSGILISHISYQCCPSPFEIRVNFTSKFQVSSADTIKIANSPAHSRSKLINLQLSLKYWFKIRKHLLTLTVRTSSWN